MPFEEKDFRFKGGQITITIQPDGQLGAAQVQGSVSPLAFDRAVLQSGAINLKFEPAPFTPQQVQKIVLLVVQDSVKRANSTEPAALPIV